MASTLYKVHLDKIGMSASLLCAIHCLAIPILISGGIISSISWLHHPLVEWSLISLAIFIAGKSFSKSFKKHHQSYTPIIIGLVGFVMLIISRFAPHSLEHQFAALGGVILAVAHYVNWKKLRSC